LKNEVESRTIDHQSRAKSTLLELRIVENGAIFLLHKDILKFGTDNKPRHFALCPNVENINDNFFQVHPCTSQFRKDKAIFQFDLRSETNTNINSSKKTCLFFNIIRNIQYLDYSIISASKKGKLNNETYLRYLTEKKEYIQSNY